LAVATPTTIGVDPDWIAAISMAWGAIPLTTSRVEGQLFLAADEPRQER